MNHRELGTFLVILVCLVSVMSPAMTQSSIPMFSNAGNATDEEADDISEPTTMQSPPPETTPVLSPTSEQNSGLSPTSNQTQTSTHSPSHSPTPTPTRSHASPASTLSAHSSPVLDAEDAPRTLNITTNQSINVSRLLNDTEVTNNQSNVTGSSYANASAMTGTWNVSALASNENSTDVQTLKESNTNLTTDLAVTSIELETGCGASEQPCFRYAGYALNVTVTIANLGVADASDFVVTFRDESSQFNETEISHLPAGTSCSVNALWDLSDLDIGGHTITVEVKPCNNSDSNLTNNINSLEGVGVANPWEINMTLPATNPEEGDKVAINARITNKGPLSANLVLNFSCLDRYGNRILFDTKPLRIDANSVNCSDAIWDARPLFIGLPDKISTTRTIEVEVANSDLRTSKDLEVELSSNLTITSVHINPSNHIYNETANVVAITLKNSENVTANTTLWLYDVNTTAQEIGYSPTPELLSIYQPGALNMGLHFFNKIVFYEAGPGCWYEVYDMNGTILMNESRSSSNKKTVVPSDIWSKWGAGDAITLKYFRIEATVESATLLNSMPVTVNACETENVTLSYELAEPDGVNTLWLVLSNGNNVSKTVGGTDLAVNLSVDETVLEGDLLNITARINNLEYINATNFSVRFYIDSSLFHEENISYLSGVEYPDNSTTIEFSWEATTWNADKGENVFTHTILVELDPCDNIDNNASNNEEASLIRVYNDFAVSYLNMTPNPCIGDTVAINSTIQYLGNRSSSANVSFYVKKADDIKRLITSTFICFDASGVCVTNWTTDFDNSTNFTARVTNVTANWTVDVSGNCTITVEVEPEWDVNITNNIRSITRAITAPDFVLEHMRIKPESPISGTTANISVTARNTGGLARATNISFYNSTRDPVDYYRSMFMNPTEYGLETAAIVCNKTDTVAMRLYLELQSHGDYFQLYDCKGRLMATYNTSFSGWTSWILGNRIDVEIEKPKGSSSSIEVTVYKYDYLMPEDELNSLPVVINPTDVRNVTTGWTASPAGEHRIVAIIDPKDAVPEINETNNVQMNLTLVQGPDLIVSDIKLRNITDGTELNAANMSADELVNITANVSNIGVLPANNFNVSFFINELCVGSATIINLTQNESTNVSTCWHAEVGNYRIVATADPGNELAETNESNNKGELRVKVLGADLTVNISFNTTANRDNVTVTVNSTVTNQGVLQTNNFDSFLFFGQYKNEHGQEVIPCFYGADDVYNSISRVNRSYAGANCICVHVNATWHLENGEKVYWVKEGDIRIYDGKEEVAVPTEPCCIPVMSDTVSVSVLHGEGQGVELLFYPGDITIRNRSLGVDDTFNISLVETAGKGIYTACIDADSEGVVPEHDKQNNQQVKQLKVLPDFWISNISISGNDTELNGKNDGSTLYINASITNSGLIAGVSDVDVFAVHDWVDITPRFELSPQGYPYGYGYVITHPGADALKIQFKSLNITTKNAPSIETRGFVYIRDKAGKLVEEWQENRQGPANSSWITGDTAYVYAPTKCDDRTESNVVIDKYQCMNRIANISGLELQAEETKNYTVMWTPANAGPHAIQMVIDPENKAAEMNESNNDLNKSFYVVPYEDPAVVNITFDPLPPVPKNVPVNVTAHIFNNGNSTANFSVDLWSLKEEIYDFETAHPTDDFNESIATYPEANWTGVQFANIGLDNGSITRRMKVEDLYKNNKNTSAYFYSFNGENIEVWTKGNTTKIELLPFNSVSYDDREATEADGGRKVWGCGIDKISHKICLNHTAVSLGPGNSTNVTGILHQMRVGNGSSGYEIHAVVDMDNVLYEQNESNNELVKALNAKIPDLTVSNITCEGPPKAEIENIGHEKADNVTVRFSRDVYTGDKEVRPFKVQNDGFYSILHKDAKVMRVHFEYLYVDEKKNGSLRIGNRTSWVDYKKDRPKGFWSSWVDVDSERDSITHPVSLILNKGRYKVDGYEYGVDVPHGTAKPYEIGTKVTRPVDVPFTVENEIYNLTVFADPENRVEESNEGNNEEKKMMGPDLTIENVTFLNEAGVEREWEKLIINETHKIKVVVKNTGCVAASNFAVRFYINNSDDNVTIISFSKEDINLAPGMTKEVEFSWKPSKRGWFIAKAEVDPHKKVPELDEKNNIYPLKGKREMKVGYPGYKAKDGFMHMFKEGKMIQGGVIYNYGTEFSRLSSATTDDFRTTYFGDPVPENADVSLVRLYVYPDNALYRKKIGDYKRKMGFLPNETQLIVYFNGNENPLHHPTDPQSDIPDATGFNVTYATYYYDIPVNDYNHSEGARNWAKAERRNCGGPRHYQFGIAGMALLIVYEDENAPITRYWVGEDRDVMMAGSNYHPTGLDYDECTRKIKFTGVTEASLANATLKTVLVSYNTHGEDDLYPEAKGRADALYFNGREIPRSTEDEDIGFWEKVIGDIALTNVHEGWEYVNVFDGINDAAIQSRGTMMGVAHAILTVEYLPDLVPRIPRSVVVGLPMTVDIENKGKSEARNFSVCFSVNGEPERKVDVTELGGGSRVQLTLPWTPRAVGQIVKLNVSVDCSNAVRELNEDNNAVTQLVAVRGMLPRLRGGGSSASAWKEGSGTGEGTGEGPGAGTTAGAAGKTVTGGKTGKTITGRLMKGTVARTEETGGGGSVKFSLFALLIRLAVVAVAVSFVCVGYLWERRWHKKE